MSTLLIDANRLLAAHDDLIQTAGEGGFRPPAPPGDWSAELVLAHVIAAGRSFALLSAALLDGREVAYEGGVAGRRELLEAIVEAAGDWDGLVATLRQSGAELAAVIRRMDEEAAGRVFPSVIRDGERVINDQPQSLASLIEGHASVHLPLHARQLQSLRG